MGGSTGQRCGFGLLGFKPKTLHVVLSRVAAVLLLIVSIALISAAADNYPGRRADGAVTVDLASVFMGDGVMMYYRIYGNWPESWREVTRTGLIQVPLLNMNGQLVDPDDKYLDFAHDRVYLPPTKDCAHPYCVMITKSGIRKMAPFNPPRTYAEFFALAGLDGTGILDHEPRLLQFAMAHVLQTGADKFMWMHDRYPSSMEELLASGVCGLDASSINPMTNDVIHGDSRANDFYFRYNPDMDGKKIMPHILPTDDSGQTPWDFSF